jgi:hypothetical protein
VTRILAAIALGVLGVGAAKGDVIPVSSQVAPSANAAIDLLGGAIFMQPTQSQGATLNTLSESVDNALVYPAGSPLLVGDACNPSAANYCVSVDGQETASWTSAASGSVTFTNYGWHDHLATSGIGTPTAGTSNLIPLGPTQQFDYSFIADIAGTMDISYTVTYSGTDCFGMQPFDVIASGGSGGPEGTAGLAGTCGTVSGDITGPITAGAPYNFFIKNQSNLNAGLGDRTAVINATFDFSIPSTPVSPVPEPSSLLLLGTGLLGLVPILRRRIRSV